MATDSIRVSAVIPASCERIYRAWLDSREHSAFTGGKATIEPWVGGRYSVSDGNIEGTTVGLEPERRILQTWRTTEFPSDSPDSNLEILFEETEGGTRVTLVHTEIPAGQGPKYEQGWEEYYLEPMRAYFEGFGVTELRAVSETLVVVDRPVAPAKKAKKAKKAATAKRPAAKVRKKVARKTAKRAGRKKAKKPARRKAARKAARRPAGRKKRRVAAARGKTKAARRASRSGRSKRAPRKAAKKRARRKVR